MNIKFTFEELVKYAEDLGFEPRGEKSRATNYTQTYWQSPWDGSLMMVLYEGKKCIIGNRDTPEVCWITVRDDGIIASVPSRYFRKFFIPRVGFVFTDKGRQHLANRINQKEEF